jgi:hypothetical protein
MANCPLGLAAGTIGETERLLGEASLPDARRAE